MSLARVQMDQFTFLLLISHSLSCKVLPNKDHTTCGKERFIRNQNAGLSLSGSECSGLAGMGSGLYRRGQAMGEGESLWSPIICDHQMEQVDMAGY
jgi:hypothetical protein